MTGKVRWALGALCLAAFGCGGGGGKALLTYTLEPTHPVDSAIKEVAVVKFKALQRTEDTYGEVAASKLNQLLMDSKRFTMYDRRNLERVIEEQDFRESGLADPSKVRTKLPSVDAIITGSVDAGGEVHTETSQQWNAITGRMETVTTRYLTCEATVTFTMISVNTGEVINTVPEIASYDSRKSGMGAAMLGMLGMPTGGKVQTPQSKLPELIQECVNKFVARIAPHKVSVQVKLAGGRHDAVKTGNRYAEQGLWREAERQYRMAVEADAENRDYGAHYNLGLALESQGKLDEAAAEYQKAIDIKANKEYFAALKRVQDLGAKSL
jgi:curli biogenesis system outer membrane secretion channel CsgG